MKNRKKGFTLVELLVVMAIIAILAAIVVPNVTSYIRRARATRALGDIEGIELALTKMVTDASVSSLNHLFDANKVRVWLYGGDPSNVDDLNSPTYQPSVGLSAWQWQQAQKLYTHTIYALMREGRAILADTDTTDDYLANPMTSTNRLAFIDVLRRDRIQLLGTSYNEELGFDPWGELYNIWPGPWRSTAGLMPFRIYAQVDTGNRIPGSKGSAFKPDYLTRTITDPETELPEDRGFCAPRDKLAFIWSNGNNMVSGQLIYNFTDLVITEDNPNAYYNDAQEEEYTCGGDDVNNWDPNQTWMLFYN